MFNYRKFLIMRKTRKAYDSISILSSTGLDQYGEPVHASMYYDLWNNNPHCSNEYPDYTFEEHFGKTLPAYVPRAVVRHYLEGNSKSVPTLNRTNLYVCKLIRPFQCINKVK